MHNEVKGKNLIDIKKSLSNLVQNMTNYNIQRDFYYFIGYDNIQQLIPFLQQDLETDDWLIETPTALPGDHEYQNHNFWIKITIYFNSGGKIIFKNHSIILDSKSDTIELIQPIYNEFIGHSIILDSKSDTIELIQPIYNEFIGHSK